MLGKLLKYDFKDAKMLIPAYGLSIGSSLISFILFKCGAFGSENGFILVLSYAQFLFSVLTVMGVLIASVVIVIINFGKHTVGAQGQMMFTLPVSIDQFLAAKIISSSAIMTGSMVYLFAWMAAVLASANVLQELGIIFGQTLTVQYILLMILGILASTMMYHTSIALSGRFSQNRVLGSVVAYLCISFAVQIITVIMFVIGGFMLATNADYNMINDPIALFNIIMIFAIVFYGIMIVAGYLVTRHEFSKKINLP